MPPMTRTFVLSATRPLTPRVLLLQFRLQEGGPLSFIPGQFITLHFEKAGKRQLRSYSLCNVNAHDCEALEIAIAYVQGGVASETLFHMPLGATMEATGPIGLFVLKEEEPPPSRYVFIATGTGVSPYVPMLPTLKKQFDAHPTLEAHVVLGVRQKEDLLFSDLFRDFARENPRFHFTICYSQWNAEHPLAPDERAGRLQTHLPSLSLHSTRDTVYLCGNPNMIDEVSDYLMQQSFEKRQIRKEKYAFSH